MSDKGRDFHIFALQSSLFKGHSDWYFCFLKSERIAHVVLVLSENIPTERSKSFKELVETAASLPLTIAHLAADEIELSQVLAEIFSLIVLTRFLATANHLSKETAQILVGEYEALAEKLDAAARLSPFVTSEDFLIQPMIEQPRTSPPAIATELARRSTFVPKDIKDINKGHTHTSQEQTSRLQVILDYVRSRNGVSIKDIRQLPDSIVKDCSEKTIQRELAELVRQGLIKKVGERRWSLYEPT